MNREELERQILDTNFVCQCCGACCSGSDNEVMVSPDEVDTIMAVTNLSFEDIAEPYPDWVEFPDGTRLTFGWVLRRGVDGNCMFLEDGRCRIYASRPHICRTYPFMLDGDTLIVSECQAVGCSDPETAKAEAEDLAAALLVRCDAEDAEFQASERQYQKHSIVPGSTYIIDSRGVHPQTHT